MFKIFRGSLEKEYQELALLQEQKKKIIVESIVKGISLFLILFFGYLITISIIINWNLFNSNGISIWKTWIILPLLFWWLFLSIFWLLLTFVIKWIKEIKWKINSLEKIISIKKEENRNYKEKIKPIEKLILDLKYKINLTNVQHNNFQNSLEKIIEVIKQEIFTAISYENNTPDEKLGCIIKTIFNPSQNGNNNKVILEKLDNKDDLFKFLFYIILTLRKLDEVWLWDYDSLEKNESILLNLKKWIEQRILTLNKIEKQNQIFNEERKKNIEELFTKDIF